VLSVHKIHKKREEKGQGKKMGGGLSQKNREISEFEIKILLNA
jgi:hypothetical protein